MGSELRPGHVPQLDKYIYDYLMSRNMISTAQTFLEETRGTPSAPDFQNSDVADGFLSDWWSIFWDRFSSRPSVPKGGAPEEKPVEVGDHLNPEEEQMQQRAANLANSNRTNNAVDNHIKQQDPVSDSAVNQRSLGSTPVDVTPPGLMQQPSQQQTDGKATDDMLDLPRDVSTEKRMGIAIEEVFSLKASDKKMFSCAFTSDGEVLASAGDENKVFVYNLRNNLEKHTWEGHSSFITDMSFKPNKTMLATSSSDKTVRLWDASQGGHCIDKLVGHSSLVRSVDFHPREDSSLLCSCDDDGKVLFWTIGQRRPRISQATGRGKLRFDPSGQCLASVIGSTVNLTNVETDQRIGSFQGNRDNKTVQSIAWNEHYRCFAAVCDYCVKVWPSQGGGHSRELSGTHLSYFRSCSFHPQYPNTLVIGGYQTITLWNFAENKKVAVQPHGSYVADLAGCYATELLASGSTKRFPSSLSIHTTCVSKPGLLMSRGLPNLEINRCLFLYKYVPSPSEINIKVSIRV